MQDLKAEQAQRAVTLGRVLRKIRAERELSLAELANKIGASRQYVSSVEKGRRSLSGEKLKNWAKVLQADEKVLLELLKQPHRAVRKVLVARPGLIRLVEAAKTLTDAEISRLASRIESMKS